MKESMLSKLRLFVLVNQGYLYRITYTPARNCKTVQIDADNASASLIFIKVMI